MSVLKGIELLSSIEGKTVTLVGAGVSNMPLAAFLAERGARLTVRDKKSEEQLGERAEKLRALGARLILGEDYLCGIDEEIIFRSPGFRPDLPEFADAVARGSILTSEIKLFLECCPCPVAAITGSDGKSTTTTVTSKIFEKAFEGTARRSFLGGNIGEPLLHRIDSISPDDRVSAELSSFQLMDVDCPVDCAVITNITPNHLNWHTGMNEYIAAKARLLTHAHRAVLNYGNDITRGLGQKCTCPVTYFSRNPIPVGSLRPGDSAIFPKDGVITMFTDGKEIPVLRLSDILLPGLHNAENYMAAIAASWGVASPEDADGVARTFGGVAHRLQLIREKDGVYFYNSSIDSSPTRTAAALDALGSRPIVLICGGYDKKIPYEPLADAIFAHPKVRAVFTTGQTGPRIAELIRNHEKYADSGLTLSENPSFDETAAQAASFAVFGDCVLLSPASASFDAFENFEQRGNHFADLVRAL